MKLIKISSVWCPSCIIMNPRYMEITKKYSLECEDYDYDMDTDIVKKYEVGNLLPVVIVLNNNEEVARIIGEKSQKELIKIFEDIGV